LYCRSRRAAGSPAEYPGKSINDAKIISEKQQFAIDGLLIDL
jgi:hypothetical protein